MHLPNTKIRCGCTINIWSPTMISMNTSFKISSWWFLNSTWKNYTPFILTKNKSPILRSHNPYLSKLRNLCSFIKSNMSNLLRIKSIWQKLGSSSHCMKSEQKIIITLAIIGLWGYCLPIKDSDVVLNSSILLLAMILWWRILSFCLRWFKSTLPRNSIWRNRSKSERRDDLGRFNALSVEIVLLPTKCYNKISSAQCANEMIDHIILWLDNID